MATQQTLAAYRTQRAGSMTAHNLLVAEIEDAERAIAAYLHQRLAHASTQGARFRVVYVRYVVCDGDRFLASHRTSWAHLSADEQTQWEAAASAYEPELGHFTPNVCVHCYAVNEPCNPTCPLALHGSPHGT